MQTNKQILRRHVLLVLKGLHFVGLALFLGTIVSSIVIDIHIEGRGLTALAEGRQAVSLISHALIMSGLGLMIVTGIGLSILRYGFRWPRWILVKILFVVVIFGVAFFALLPALDSATVWAVRSAKDGILHSEYTYYLTRESIFGIANMLVFIGAAVFALWKPRLSS